MRIKRTLRAAVFAVIAALAAAVLVGCGARVAVYDYTQDGVRYNKYEITVDEDVVENIELTAGSDADGNKYTLAGYLYTLFTEYGYELVEATVADGKYTVSYRKAVADATSEFDRYCTEVKFTATSTSNPFIRTVTSTSPNPFNGLRERYDNIPQDRSVTMLERLKNGLVAHTEYGDTVTVFPSIDGAFPELRGANLDGLLLTYGRVGSDRMESSGTATSIGNRTVMYEFSRYFDYADTELTFEYKRAVPYGWYIVALLAGVVAFAVILYVCRRRYAAREYAAAEQAENTAEADGTAPTIQANQTDNQSDNIQGDKDNAQTE